MKSKKNILLMMMLIFAFMLAACSTGRPSASEGGSSAESEGSMRETGSENDGALTERSSVLSDSTQTEGSVLVAYFSHTGNTKQVAQQIADLTGGSLAEIQRAEKYGDLQEEAEAEILESIRPEITVSMDDITDYDTVFVGYPIWLAYHKLIQCTQLA